jgi:hypothetical protein
MYFIRLSKLNIYNETNVTCGFFPSPPHFCDVATLAIIEEEELAKFELLKPVV